MIWYVNISLTFSFQPLGHFQWQCTSRSYLIWTFWYNIYILYTVYALIYVIYSHLYIASITPVVELAKIPVNSILELWGWTCTGKRWTFCTTRPGRFFRWPDVKDFGPRSLDMFSLIFVFVVWCLKLFGHVNCHGFFRLTEFNTSTTPLKFNMEPENQPLGKEISNLETSIFRFHVRFRGCTSFRGFTLRQCEAIRLRLRLQCQMKFKWISRRPGGVTHPQPTLEGEFLPVGLWLFWCICCSCLLARRHPKTLQKTYNLLILFSRSCSRF